MLLGAFYSYRPPHEVTSADYWLHYLSKMIIMVSPLLSMSLNGGRSKYLLVSFF